MRRGLTVLLAGTLALVAGCGADEPKADEDGRVSVEMGEAFTHGDFEVESGWRLERGEQVISMEATSKPVVTGVKAANRGSEERFVLFEFVFSHSGERVSTVMCSSAVKAAPGGAAVPVQCDGMGQVYPQDYDRITVQDISR